MKKSISFLLVTLLFGVSRAMAADSVATVTEAVNQVDHGPSQSADTSPAKIGTKLHDGEYLKTGPASRAEMELSDKTITRMGANTIFNYSSASNQIDLQAGTILFSKPKDGKQMNIKTAAVTAAIVGTTGIVKGGKSFLFGLVEGKSVLTINGTPYTVHGGQMLVYVAPGPPVIFAFNLALFLKTSRLVKDFTHPLPNQKYIDEALADYNDGVRRGFIQVPPQEPFFDINFTGTIPTVPFIAHDSAGNALNFFNTPPPSPSQQSDECERRRCCRSECDSDRDTDTDVKPHTDFKPHGT